MEAPLRAATYVVVPPRWYDPLPVIRAFASALPVIASSSGELAGLVDHGRNGLLFDGTSRDLARCLAWAEAFPERMRQMGECAKADYLARFVADFGYPRLFGERRRAARP